MRNRRFQSLREHGAFEGALSRHCHEAALIVEEYASGWFSKANYEGGIDEKMQTARHCTCDVWDHRSDEAKRTKPIYTALHGQSVSEARLSLGAFR